MMPMLVKQLDLNYCILNNSLIGIDVFIEIGKYYSTLIGKQLLLYYHPIIRFNLAFCGQLSDSFGIKALATTVLHCMQSKPRLLNWGRYIYLSEVVGDLIQYTKLHGEKLLDRLQCALYHGIAFNLLYIFSGSQGQPLLTSVVSDLSPPQHGAIKKVQGGEAAKLGFLGF